MARRLILTAALSLGAGCATPTYLYNFDLTDPGAKNYTKPGQRDVMDDGDVKAEILADPVNFRAIALELTNETGQSLSVYWNNIIMIGPDGTEAALRPAGSVGEVESHAKVFVTLIPFMLPSEGAPAQAYEGSTFQLVVPMVVKGSPREYRYHLRASLQRL